MDKSRFKSLRDLLKNFENKRKSWKHKDASSYAKSVIHTYGDPQSVGIDSMEWRHIPGFKSVVVKDESVLHKWPKEHKDFIYATKKIKVPKEKAMLLPMATGSIINDGLKNEVTARCGTLYANAVTLGFVEDLVAGKIKPDQVHETYKEYITEGKLPKWYKNRMKE